MFVIVFSEFKTPRLVIGRLQYYHFYFIYSGSHTSNTKNCAENNEFSSHILRWITILLRHDVYKRSSTKWPKKRLKRGQNRQISLGFLQKVNVTPRKCQLKYNWIFFKKSAFQNAVAMTTLNGLNNDMSELLQGLTSIVRFREMSILWVRPK